MAHMTNRQFAILSRMRTEMEQNDGYVSQETFTEFSELMQEIQSDKSKANEKTRLYIAERRKTDKNYARSKKKRRRI